MPSTLHTELWEHIFDFLPDAEIFRIYSINRAFLQRARHLRYGLLKIAQPYHPPPEEKFKFGWESALSTLSNFPSLWSYVQTLEVSSDAPKGLLLTRPERIRRLATLFLPYYLFPSLWLIEKALSKLHSLQSLHVTYTTSTLRRLSRKVPCSHMDLVWMRCSQTIVDLHIHVEKAGLESLTDLPSSIFCPNIRRLSLAYCEDIMERPEDVERAMERINNLVPHTLAELEIRLFSAHWGPLGRRTSLSLNFPHLRKLGFTGDQYGTTTTIDLAPLVTSNNGELTELRIDPGLPLAYSSLRLPFGNNIRAFSLGGHSFYENRSILLPQLEHCTQLVSFRLTDGEYYASWLRQCDPIDVFPFLEALLHSLSASKFTLEVLRLPVPLVGDHVQFHKKVVGNFEWLREMVWANHLGEIDMLEVEENDLILRYPHVLNVTRIRPDP